MKTFFNLLFFICLLFQVAADNGSGNNNNGELFIKKNVNPEQLKLDGALDEEFWQNTGIAKDFYRNFPVDSGYSNAKTEVRVMYDQDKLYIGVVCYEVSPEKRYTVSSLKRDFDFDTNDNFTIFIDPFKDGVNGFMFGITPMGVEREGMMSGGDNVDMSWDNKWYSAVQRLEDRWTAEMVIPFKSIRFEEGISSWKMNFARNDLKNNEKSSWQRVPINFRVSSLAFTGETKFEEALKRPAGNISLIPYVSSRGSKDYVSETKTNSEANAGFDAKIALSSSLNLDLTVNPDFSQVEVDQQVTNLDRFEIFFPERRQFFVENSDLFSQFGFSRIRPFFSRRIGIARDTVTGLIRQTPIPFGARLSGKLNKKLRVGALHMRTAADEERGIKSQRYSVATFQQQVLGKSNFFGRSNVSGILVNREIFNDQSDDRYTRVAGLDFNLLSKDGKWSGRVFYHRAFKPNNGKDAQATAGWFGYRGKKLTMFWNHEYVGKDYKINDVGYVARMGLWRLEPYMEYRVFFKKKKVNNIGLFSYTNFYTDKEFTTTDRNHELGAFANFMNTSFANVGYGWNYVKLLSELDPSFLWKEGTARLEEGTSYKTQYYWANYFSDRRKSFTYNLSSWGGTHYNGKIHNYGAGMSYRFQPYGSVGFNVSHTRITLPEGFSDARLWLFSPKVDVSFTRKVFLTTFFQYNNQTDNVNINTRLQWRFKPVSDLFLVYSENYFSDMRAKNRALVLKLTYWINV